jgi:hypothetical protein
MHIEILHVPDCPHLRLARSRVSIALERIGTAASVDEICVTSPKVADELGMHGSPTITIDGSDPFDHGQGEGSMSCRLYRAEGRIDGAPGVAELIEVIGRAQCQV